MLRSPNNPWTVALWLAILKAGGVVGATFAALRPGELTPIVERCRPTMVLVDHRFAEGQAADRAVQVGPPRPTVSRTTCTSSTSGPRPSAAGLVMTEMTCVPPEGGSPSRGLWADEKRDAWAWIVDSGHGDTTAKIGRQIGHSGRKGSTKLLWEGMDEPLDDANWAPPHAR